MEPPPSARDSRCAGVHRHLAAIVPAAGAGRRMGALKPLLPLAGRTVIERVVDTFLKAGIDDIMVVVGHRGAEVACVAQKAGAGWVDNPCFGEGMLSSIRTGLAALPPRTEAFFVLPSDICLVRASTIGTLRGAWRENGARSLLYPTFMGRRGHPPLIPGDWRDAVTAYAGPDGLGGFLRTREVDAREVPVADAGILFDMDTPEDYREARRRADRAHIPTAAECEALMRLRFEPAAPVIEHCRRVARIAGALADALNRAGCRLDTDLLCAAGRVHDLGKGLPDHAAAGRRLLAGLGFAEVGAVVGEHMDLEDGNRPEVGETEILYLADKLVQGAAPVDLRTRFEDKLRRHGDDPVKRTAIVRRRDQALAVAARVEALLGQPLQSVLGQLEQ